MRKNIVIAVLFFINIITYGQEIDYNIDNGYVAEGYDVVSYFFKTPLQGNDKFIYSYRNIKLKFSSQSNLDLFKTNPEKYLPQYGGWCAYAMGKKGEKVSIDPKTYEIRNGKLYLFYNSWLTNTFDLWLKEKPLELKMKADKNWKLIKYKDDERV